MSDNNPDVAVRSKPIFERHFQTLLLTLVAGLIAWQGMTTLKLSESSARQDERVSHLIGLTEQLRQDLRAMDSQYLPRREAEMHRNETRSKLDALESRVSRLEAVQ
ncbi:hypothetical protein HW452_16685 [Halomonas aquamarina]|uniref:Uncharacterized protein n=1 Tax=Vreelandella aquamarina TaxID=77097 RepID=A0ACC5VYB3_9GAMM|nr:hypothetical protein [Halomonas aquamarina]MBZ5489158.1 hypothetical protein [Halomonas aquamarina]